MQTKYMYNGVEFVIIFKKEISEYYLQPFADMYNDLKSIKKTEYTNEEILITSFGWTNEYIWKHFFRCVSTLDIPTFFIRIETNNPDVKRIVTKQCSEIIPYDNVVTTNIILKPLSQKSNINDQFNYPDSLCINPFASLEVGVAGYIDVCCEIAPSDNLPKRPNIKDTTIHDAWQSDYVQQIRNDFLSGKKPQYCNICWRKEAMGLKSKRQRDLFTFQDLYFTTDFRKDHKLSILDMKLGFSCNLKCRICSHDVSSAWYAEDKKYHEVPAVELLDYGFTLNRKFWSNIENLKDLEYITFAGGEPFLDRTHIALLEKLVDLGKTNTRIHYNTNGTHFKQDYFDVLDKFDSVSITFSIDNTGRKFELERHGSTWQTVMDNLEKFSKLNKERYTLDFYPTVSVFNILDLDTVLDCADSFGFKHSLNFVDYPKHFSINNIPLTHRKSIIDLLNTSTRDSVKSIIPLLEQNTYYNLLEDFWKEIDRIDLRRNENFREIYPEVSNIMN